MSARLQDESQDTNGNHMMLITTRENPEHRDLPEAAGSI